MPTDQDSKWLSALRSCRNIASRKNVDHMALNEELNALTQVVRTSTRNVKARANLESFLQFMILDVDLDWISWSLDDLDSDGWESLSQLFLACPPDSVLLSLLTAFTQLSTGARQELCLRLLELYFKQERFATLLLQESTFIGDKGLYEKTIFQNILTSLNSLPNKVANNTLGKFGDIFHHERFFQLLSIQTGDVIQKLVDQVRKGKDISTNFISQMLGLFCFSGKADEFLGTLLPLLVSKCCSDFVWRKIVQKIISGLSDRHLEVSVTYISKEIPWHGCLKWIFEDSILRNAKLKFLLLHKLVLVKHFPTSLILKNVLGYIADDSKTRNLLIETVKKLLSVWGDSSAIKHVSYEQHKYVTQAILICIGHLTKEQLELHGHDLNMWLASGMSSHLDSSDSKVRRLGMIVGEAIAQKTDFEGINKLEFGYEKDEETESMMKLLKPDPPPTDSYFQDLHKQYQITKQEIVTQIKNKENKSEGAVKRFATTKATFLKVISSQGKAVEMEEKNDTQKENAGVQEELDSDDEEEDDDLRPYDMSNDTTYRKVKPPMYIRDCMEGLAERENREKFEVSINALKDLIQRNPVAAKEVAIELCRVLLDLDNVYALDDFTTLRLSAMTELTVIDPEKVASYLTREFYAEEYCLQHRLDILDVLTAAARILSSVENEGDGENGKELPNEIKESHSSESWREIVDKRIEAKTRRFGKGKKRVIMPKENKFGLVAGCFFYPLLAGYDRRIRTLDLLGNDAIVLGRLLYSIGMIVYSAINTMAAKSMAKSLLDFILEIRFHSEAYVRQAVLFCISMATITAGKNLLGCEALDEVTEWVHEVLTNDTNTRTKQLAAQTAMTMSTKFCKDMKVGL